MSYTGMCGPKGCGLLAVLVVNRVSILVILLPNRVWFLHSCLEFGYFFQKKLLFRHYREDKQLKPYKMPLTSV